MKKIIYLLVLISINTIAQTKYFTKTGTISFEASVPSFEEVKAKNSSSTAIINTENGEFAALALVKGFRFKNALMEEHFNENYAESDKYPKAIFKGNIVDFSFDKLKNGKNTFIIKGELTFHGKTVMLEDTKVKVTFKEGLLNISGNFITDPANFNIEIPKIVRNKVAKDINVFFNFSMKKK